MLLRFQLNIALLFWIKWFHSLLSWLVISSLYNELISLWDPPPPYDILQVCHTTFKGHDYHLVSTRKFALNDHWVYNTQWSLNMFVWDSTQLNTNLGNLISSNKTHFIKQTSFITAKLFFLFQSSNFLLCLWLSNSSPLYLIQGPCALTFLFLFLLCFQCSLPETTSSMSPSRPSGSLLTSTTSSVRSAPSWSTGSTTRPPWWDSARKTGHRKVCHTWTNPNPNPNLNS